MPEQISSIRVICVLIGAALIELGGKYVSGLFGGMILWSAWKMLKSVRLPSETQASLGVITGIIATGVVTSLVSSFRKRAT